MVNIKSYKWLLMLPLFLPSMAFAAVDTANPIIDGGAGAGGSPSWSTIRDAATGSADNSSTTEQVSVQKHSNTNFYLNRGFLTFDLDIGSNVVDSGSVLIYVTAAENQSSTTKSYVRLYGATFNGTGSYINDDYSACGSTPLSDSINLSSITTSAYNEFVLNAAGIAAFGSGINEYCLRIGYDGENVAMSSTAIDYITFASIENADSAKHPYISITSHTASSSSSSSSSSASTGTGVTFGSGELLALHHYCNAYGNDEGTICNAGSCSEVIMSTCIEWASTVEVPALAFISDNSHHSIIYGISYVLGILLPLWILWIVCKKTFRLFFP